MATLTGTTGLKRFRAGFYSCLTRWGDALFELCDAGLCAAGPIGSVPALSLEPQFTRSHGSLYKSLARGRVDEDRLRRLLVDSAPPDWPLVFAVDASTWDRCDAETSPERGFYYSASKHSAGQPIVAGWSLQWISQLCFTPDSWTAPMDVARLSPSKDTTGATIEQVRRLVELLPAEHEVPLFVFDAGYDPIGLAYGLAGTRAQILCRIRDDRVFYADPPARAKNPGTGKPGTRGRPPRHGRRMKCSEPRTWGPPTQRLVTEDPRYGTVTVTAWADLHPKLAGRGRWAGHASPPIVKGTVIRVEVHHLPKPTARTKKTLWLFWSGPDNPDLALCWRAYLRRFDIEHTFRFAKNTLGWTSPSVCTPEQAERWTWLVVGMLTQLRLARDHVQDIRLPNDPANPTSSPQHAPAEDFADFVHSSAHRPVHRKPQPPVPDDPRAPENRPVPATQPSNEPREPIVEV